MGVVESIKNRVAASVVVLGLSSGVSFAYEAGEMVVLPEGSEIDSVASPNGNGRGICGFNALVEAFNMNSRDSGSLGLTPYSVSKSLIGDQPQLMVIEATFPYHNADIDGVVSTLNTAFGDGVARQAVPNDYNDPSLLEKIGNKAIVVSGEFAAEHWGYPNIQPRSRFCAELK